MTTGLTENARRVTASAVQRFSASRQSPAPALWLDQMAARPGLVPSLNGLRAFAITIVFLSHAVDDRIFPGGFGVRVFFVISGFLITRLLFLEARLTGTLSIRAFYTRRILRLYPAILVYAAVIVASAMLRHDEPIRLMEPVSALMYFANYYYALQSQIGTDPTLPFTVFWSLSLEEHFYLIFPVAFVVMGARARRIALFCVALGATCLLLRTAGALLWPQLLGTYTFYMETQYQLDAIGFGVGLAACCEFAAGRAFVQRFSARGPLLLACGVILACFAVRNPFFRETLRYSMLSLSVTVVIAALLFRPCFVPVQRLLNTWLMDRIGRLSYGIYVWHTGIAYLVQTPQPTVPNVALQTGLTLLVALASYRFIEHPLASLRHRFGSVAPRNAA